MDHNDIGQKTEEVAKNIISDIRKLPINGLLLSGLAGIGVLSVVSYIGKFFSAQK